MKNTLLYAPHEALKALGFNTLNIRDHVGLLNDLEVPVIYPFGPDEPRVRPEKLEEWVEHLQPRK